MIVRKNPCGQPESVMSSPTRSVAEGHRCAGSPAVRGRRRRTRRASRASSCRCRSRRAIGVVACGRSAARMAESNECLPVPDQEKRKERDPASARHFGQVVTRPATSAGRHGLRGGSRGHRLCDRRFAPRLDTNQDPSIRIEEGDPNGLEDSENCRTAGRSGNQHVRLCGAQVTGRLDVSGCGGVGLRGRSD